MTENPEEPGRPAATGPAAAESRCPACGARVVPDQPWCSLCLRPLSEGADERADEQPGSGSEPSDAAALPADTGVHGTTEGDHEPASGPAGTTGGDARRDAQAAAEAMLAELAVGTAADRPLARWPLRGLGRAGLLGVGCLAALVMLGVGLGLLWLVGTLL